MYPPWWGSILGASSMPAAGTIPLQAGSTVSSVLETPILRAIVAAGLVLLLGGALLWRYESIVDRSIDASLDKPLHSMAYGVATHLVLSFAGFYLVVRLGQFTVSGLNAGGIGVLFWVAAVLAVGAFGFTTVGSILVDFRGSRRPWQGLLVGALIAGAIALVNVAAGVVCWFLVVSMGIGGPIRQWFTATALSDVRSTQE